MEVDLNCFRQLQGSEIILKILPFNTQNTNNTDFPVFYNTHIMCEMLSTDPMSGHSIQRKGRLSQPFLLFSELPFHIKIPHPLLNSNALQYYFNDSVASVPYIFLYPTLPPNRQNP